MKLGLGLGLTKGGYIAKTSEQIADDFERRVSNDGGKFEAKQCLVDILKLIQ